MQRATAVTKRRAQLSAAKMRQLRDRVEPRMAAAARNFAVGQAGRAVSRLMGRKALKMTPHASELIPPEEDGLMMAALEIYYREGIDAALNYASSVLNSEPPSFDPIVQAELRRAGVRISGINDVTRQAVRDLLEEANMRGYNLYEIATGVPGEDFPGLRDVVEEVYNNRAETIARTELAYATQHAAHDDWKQSGVQEVDIEDGVDFDEECAARNGTRVSIEEDVEPLHPRCTVVSLPVIEGYGGEE